MILFPLYPSGGIVTNPLPLLTNSLSPGSSIVKFLSLVKDCIEKLSSASSIVFRSLPEGIAVQLTLDRDPHGNVQVSRIETENCLSIWLKQNWMSERKRKNSLC